jgi:catechol 2,3-dioxygenase-like lactoylglutathione lyase family enzyme
MHVQRHVVVLDAADLDAVSSFWARLLGGRVYADDGFHCVLDGDGRWTIGVQLAPDHAPPEWPDGNAQQVHLDLHVDDGDEAHRHALECGATLLRDLDDEPDAEPLRIYADPAGHPFCIGWGHPTDESIRRLFDTLPDPNPAAPRTS